jgi:hypothetical protein
MESYLLKSLRFNLAAIFIFLLSGTNAHGQLLKQLIPDGVIVQYGGSIGFLSGGISYDIFKNKRGNLDFSYGHVPESKGGPLDVFAVKFAYRPLKINVKDVATFFPLNPGTFISYHPGDKFEHWNSGQFSKGYYWWSRTTRVHLSLSSELKLNGKKLFGKKGIEAIGIYSELNTNELYAVSWFKNRDTMSFLDIVRVGYGVRVYF